MILPKGWQEYKFGEIFDFYGGMGIPREQLGDKGIPYLHYGDVHTSNALEINLDEQEKRIPKLDIKQSGKAQLNNGDLVFVDASEDYSGTCKTFLIKNKENKPFVSGLHTYIAREKIKVMCDEFKKYLTKIPSVRNNIYKKVVGFKVYGISKKEIAKLPIILPSYYETVEISNILNKFYTEITLQSKLLEKLKLQKKALMQKLLNPQSDWKEITISSILKKEIVKEVESIYIEISDFIVNSGRLIINKNKKIVTGAKKAKKGAILVSQVRPSRGAIFLLPISSYVSTGYSQLYIDEKKANKRYILYVLQQKRFLYRLGSLSTGSTYPTVNFNDIESYKFLIPNRKIQEYIADVLTNIDQQLFLQEQLIEKTKLQQKFLMENLLSGKIRLPEFKSK